MYYAVIFFCFIICQKISTSFCIIPTTVVIRGSLENVRLSSTVQVSLPLPLPLTGFNRPAAVIHGSIEKFVSQALFMSPSPPYGLQSACHHSWLNRKVCVSSTVRFSIPSLPVTGSIGLPRSFTIQ